MRKPTHLPLKILLFGLFGVLLAVWYLLGLPCVIRRFTGVICPGCGMSRAWLSVLRMDLASAFRYHPMFWSIPVLAIYILYDGQPIRNQRLSNCLLGLLLGGLLLCYIIRLILFLNGVLSI